MAGRSYNPGYMGYPALFFLETLHQNRGDRNYAEQMQSLHTRYSYLNAWMYDEKDGPKKDIPDEAYEKMKKLRERILALFQLYDPYFEDENTCNPEERTFLVMMCEIREWIDQIAVITRIVDNAQPMEEAFKV